MRQRTGLVIDPYFSASKIAWLLEHVPGLRAKAEAGAIAFGTVDSFLVARLTAGRVHATDVTNASRTLLFDIARKEWDDELLDAFGVPRALLPEVRQSADDYGTASEEAFGLALPIGGVAGDQQAALVGQGCLGEGSAKITFGTGAFLLHNTGARPVASQERPPHDARLRRARQDRLRARRQRLHRRCRGAVAARRPQAVQTGNAKAKPSRRPPTRRSPSTSCQPSLASARPTGMPRRAARSWVSPAMSARPRSCARPSKA